MKNERLEILMNEARMGPNSNFNSPENRLMGLLDLIEYYDLSDKEMVEIGCFLGISTEMFAMFCKKITSIDLWGIDESYDGGECPKEWWPRIENLARVRLSPYRNATLIKDFPKNYIKNIEDNSLDLIYIDGNHSYEYVKSDIFMWYDKIKTGGIFSGHDYNQDGVKKAVDECFQSKKMKHLKTFKDTSWSMIRG